MNKAQEIIEAIAAFPRFPKEERFSRVSSYLAELGNPHLKLKFVHVTGTNGKGSCCAMTASIMQAAGYKVGLFTSPHLFDWRERIQINGENITDSQIEAHGSAITDYSVGIFEAWFLMAMSVFAAENVDIVILEAGIGGKLDTTNLIPSPEVSLITNVDLEHTELLGGSKIEIAQEKAGIVKDSVLITGIEDPDLLAVLPKHISVEAEEDFRKKNELMVRALIQVLRERSWEIHERNIEEGLKLAKWPLRMEVLREDPLVIVDGAHNLHGVRALKKILPEKNHGRQFLLMGISRDKDLARMAPLLAESMDEIVITEASYHAASVEDVGRFVPDAVLIPDMNDAVQWILDRIKKEDQFYILGGLYLATDAVQALKVQGFLIDKGLNNNDTVTY